MDVVALVLTLAGIGISTWQAVRARSAAEAAKRSADAMARRVRDLMLSAVLPQLREAEQDLRLARQHGERDVAVRSIARWRGHVSEARGLLVARGALSEADDVLVSGCLGQADSAEEALAREVATVADAVTALLRDMGNLAMRLGEISAAMLTEVPRERS